MGVSVRKRTAPVALILAGSVMHAAVARAGRVRFGTRNLKPRILSFFLGLNVQCTPTSYLLRRLKILH